MIPDMLENVECSDAVWVETGDEVPFVVQQNLAIISDQLTVNSHHDFAIRYRKYFSNVVRVV